LVGVPGRGPETGKGAALLYPQMPARAASETGNEPKGCLWDHYNRFCTIYRKAVSKRGQKRGKKETDNRKAGTSLFIVRVTLFRGKTKEGGAQLTSEGFTKWKKIFNDTVHLDHHVKIWARV